MSDEFDKWFMSDEPAGRTFEEDSKLAWNAGVDAAVKFFQARERVFRSKMEREAVCNDAVRVLKVE